MAYVVDQDEENGNKQQGQNNNVPVGGDSGLITPGVQGSNSNANAPAGSSPTGSGTYTNLQDYLNVNKDQAQGLANTVGKPIENLQSQAQSGIDTGTKNAESYIQSQIPSYDTQALQDISTGKGNASDLSQEQKDQIKAAQSAQYLQPSNIADYYKDASNYANQANQLAQQAQTESGRYNLLKQAITGPNYTSGQQGLDQAILSGSPDSATYLSSFAPKSQAELDAINSAMGNEQKSSDVAAQKVTDQQKAIQDYLTKGQGAINSRLQDEVNAYNNNLLPGQAQIKDFLSNPAAGYLKDFGVDASQYANPGENVNASQIATDQERNNLNALNQLMGVQGNALPDASKYQKQIFDPNGAFDKATQQYNAYINSSNPQSLWDNYVNSAPVSYGNVGQNINSFIQEAQGQSPQQWSYIGDQRLQAPVVTQMIDAINNDQKAKAAAGLPREVSESALSDLRNKISGLSGSNNYNDWIKSLQQVNGYLHSIPATAQNLKNEMAAFGKRIPPPPSGGNPPVDKDGNPIWGI